MMITRHPSSGGDVRPVDGPSPVAPHAPAGERTDLGGQVDALHDEVENAFVEFELAEGGRARQYRALLRISDALAAHAAVEQELLDPALRELTGRHQATVERQLERQHLIDLLLVELAAMVPGERRFDTKVRMVRDLFRQHAAEQERALLPALQRHLGTGERRRLAEEVGAYARELRRAS
jgi:hypothetical protein